MFIIFINVQKVYKVLGGQRVLSNFSFFARKGDSVSVCGPNGAGKSTLLNLIAGKYTADSGSVTVDGVPAEVYCKAVLLPQNYRLAQHKTLLENLLIPLKIRGFSRKDAAALATEQLNLFKLSRFSDYYPCQLSEGLIRRAAIAEIGLFDADLLLLDEPFSGIDRDNISDIYLYLNAKRLDGVTLILVTHSEEHASVLTERSVYLERTDLQDFSKILA